MSGDDKQTPNTEEPKGPAKQTFTLRYAGASEVSGEGDDTRLRLFGEAGRDDIFVDGQVTDPVPFREALAALYEVVQSDFRYKPKDRTAWLAYQRLKQQTATMSQWQAQQAYFEWLSRNDPTAWILLDPIVTVHPDALLLEVFSKDEGAYAQLSVDWSAIETEGKTRYGTTHIDFSSALDDGVQRLRSYRTTRLTIGKEAVAVATEGEPEVIEKRIQVPEAWLRGFLQVQSAATLPGESITLAPVDLYNALRHLRLNADQKKGGRAIRVELVPGEKPRMLLEPWETLVESSSDEVFSGRTAKVVRIWGRRRLMLMRRILPFAQSVEVKLLGSGLPSVWIFRCGPITLSLCLTGFSSSSWAQALNFDVLLPRPDGDPKGLDKIIKHLEKKHVGTEEELAKASKLKDAELLQALQAACQQGRVMYDPARSVYRLRPLTAEPLPLDKLQHRNDRERVARDLLATEGAVRITKENAIHTVGTEVTGKVMVAADRREYQVTFLLNDEGRVLRAECTSPFYRKNGLKQGPSAPLIAVMIKYAEEIRRRAAQRGRARSTIQVETRIYSRRKPSGEVVYQLSLDKTRLKVRWGARSDERLRVQHLVFDSVAEARSAYFARVDELEAQGYLDATAG